MKSKKRKLTSEPVVPYRLVLVYLGVLFWVVGIAVRLVDLQIFRVDHFRQLALEQGNGFLEVDARRGEILDRRLGELATSVPMDALVADPQVVESAQETAAALAPHLGQDAEALLEKLQSPGRYVRLQEKLRPRQAESIGALQLKGVFVRKHSQRFYPNSELAAHLLGYVGNENRGLAGLEYRYDERLKGRDARVYLSLDARRRSYGRLSPEPANRGNTLVLHLDRAIQFATEEVLASTVKEHGARNGSAVVMDPRSGEVLAIASYPTFDPNHYQESDPEDRRNRAILEIFEPGSTFKVISVAGVLNEGLTDLAEVIDCTVGSLRLGNKVYREASHSFGELTVSEIVAKSSNVGTIKLVLRLGPDSLFRYIRDFGFGAKTGVDLPGEQIGLLRPVSQWSKISIGALAIGQEIGVTPLQMLRAVSVIANGGYLVRPQVVNRILSPEGDTLREFPPELVRVLPRETVDRVKRAMAQVVREGTGRAARLNGYSSAGKTGTAQKFVDGSYSQSHFVSSYVGFAPLEDPQLAAIVVINEPRKEHYGGRVAGPAFKELMERSLIQRRVARDVATAPRNELAAGQELQPAEGVPESGDRLPRAELERTVLSLLEDGPAKAETAHVFPLDGSEVPLPDFSGQTLRQVARKCAELGLSLKVSGSGRAVAQRPAAGLPVSRGAVCEVFFSAEGRATGASKGAAYQGPAAGVRGSQH